MTFQEQLCHAAKDSGNSFCLGIDPILSHIPKEFFARGATHEIHAIVPFFNKVLDILEELHMLPAAFKPNIGYFQCHDAPRDNNYAGSSALAEILKTIRVRAPAVPIILDAKRGDIAQSSANYATECLHAWDADALTVSPYMGEDSIEPFVIHADKQNKGVFVLVRTSNPGGNFIQNIESSEHKKPLYLLVADMVLGLSKKYASLGMVVGATHIEELEVVLRYVHKSPLPVLIPGIGAQGGSIQKIREVLKRTSYPAELVRVTISRGALFPWKKTLDEAPPHWQQNLCAQLKEIRHEFTTLA